LHPTGHNLNPGGVDLLPGGGTLSCARVAKKISLPVLALSNVDCSVVVYEWGRCLKIFFTCVRSSSKFYLKHNARGGLTLQVEFF
jgi:hypothetical protein